MNAVQATRLNEIFTHENHRFPDNRIFYPTKITRYTIVVYLSRTHTHTHTHTHTRTAGVDAIFDCRQQHTAGGQREEGAWAAVSMGCGRGGEQGPL